MNSTQSPMVTIMVGRYDRVDRRGRERGRVMVVDNI